MRIPFIFRNLPFFLLENFLACVELLMKPLPEAMYRADCFPEITLQPSLMRWGIGREVNVLGEPSALVENVENTDHVGAELGNLLSNLLHHHGLPFRGWGTEAVLAAIPSADCPVDFIREEPLDGGKVTLAVQFGHPPARYLEAAALIRINECGRLANVNQVGTLCSDTAGPGENLPRRRQMSHSYARTIHLQVILQRG